MTAPSTTAPVSGLVYADLPNRVIAFIVDAIVVFVLLVIVSAILAAIGLAVGASSYLASIVYAIVGLVVGAGYFIYTWTSMRATVGMRLLGMQIGNAGDGNTLTTNQAIRRYAALAAPSIVANAFASVAVIGPLLSLVALGWIIYLLWTTYKSPTKQGWHDVFANTQVVKAAKSI